MVPFTRKAPDDLFIATISFSCLYLLFYTPIWDSAFAYAAAFTAVISAIPLRLYRDFYEKHKLSILALIGLLLLSIAGSALPSKSATGSISILKGALLYVPALLAGKHLNNNRFLHYSRYLIYANTVFFIYALAIVIDWNLPYLSILRWSEAHLGNLHNLNNLIFTSLLITVVSIAFIDNKKAKGMLVACATIGIALAVTVDSEGSILGAFCASLLALFFLCKKKYRYGLLLIATLPLIALTALYIEPKLIEKSIGTLNIRSQIYHQATEAWLHRPWTGYGINTYKYIPDFAVNGKTFLYPHNLYIEALVSVGILGVSVLFALLARAFSKVNFSKIPTSACSMVAITVLCYLATKGMSDMKLLSHQTIGWFCICIGLLHGSTAKESSTKLSGTEST